MSSTPDVIKFHCPCGQKVSVPAALAGKSGTCPACKQRLQIPAASAVPPPQPPAKSRTPTRPVQVPEDPPVAATAVPSVDEHASSETQDLPRPAIPFECLRCGHKGLAAPSFAGKTARCKCGNVIEIATPAATAAPMISWEPAEQRSELDRRVVEDRRRAALPVSHPERRSGSNRRSGRDRRHSDAPERAALRRTPAPPPAPAGDLLHPGGRSVGEQIVSGCVKWIVFAASLALFNIIRSCGSSGRRY